jgi:hypothetical protein
MRIYIPEDFFKYENCRQEIAQQEKDERSIMWWAGALRKVAAQRIKHVNCVQEDGSGGYGSSILGTAGLGKWVG